MKNTTIPFPRATDGTTPAINFPPRLITPQIQEGNLTTPSQIQEGQLSAGSDLPAKIYTWQTCSKGARMVLEHMRRQTPKGAAVPWRSKTSVTPIQNLLDEGVELDDLLELVDGAAELVANGSQSGRWWYPSNVFGSKTAERWLADVATLRASQEAAAENELRLQAIAERHQQERQEARDAPAPKVTNLELRRLTDGLLATFRDKAEPVVGSEDAASSGIG